MFNVQCRVSGSCVGKCINVSYQDNLHHVQPEHVALPYVGFFNKTNKFTSELMYFFHSLIKTISVSSINLTNYSFGDFFV